MLVAGSQIAQFLMYSENGLMSKAMAGASSSGSAPEATDMFTSMSETYQEHGQRNMIAQGTLAVLALVLLVAGILLLMRRRVSKPILQGWAFAKILVGIAATYFSTKFSIDLQAKMFEDIASSGGAGASLSTTTGVLGAMQWGMFVLTVIWLCAFPVLILIWLNRAPIKRDIAAGPSWK